MSLRDSNVAAAAAVSLVVTRQKKGTSGSVSLLAHLPVYYVTPPANVTQR